MKTLKNLLRSVTNDNKKTGIKVISGKLIKRLVVIVMLSSIIFLLPSCMVGFRTGGHERHGVGTTERRDGGDRHDNNDHHDNDKNRDHDDHH